MAELNYRVNNQELEQSIEAVPAGDYIAIIEASNYEPLSNGNGMCLKLIYQIIEGNFKGRKIFENLNIQHINHQAQTISKQALNSIGVAVGVDKIEDSSQLHDIPMKLDVIVKESPEFGRQNKIRKHLPLKMVDGTNNKPEQTNVSQFVSPSETPRKKQAWE